MRSLIATAPRQGRAPRLLSVLLPAGGLLAGQGGLAAVSAPAQGSAAAPRRDPRSHHHGAVILDLQGTGTNGYYVTWSSSSRQQWEHDIYREVVHVQGSQVVVDQGPVRFIGNGSDEAQEPVAAAIDPRTGRILTAFEDGSGSTIDVRAQLHHADGSVIRAN